MASTVEVKKDEEEEEEEEEAEEAAAAKEEDEPGGSVAELSTVPSTELAASPQLVRGLPGPWARWLYWLWLYCA